MTIFAIFAVVLFTIVAAGLYLHKRRTEADVEPVQCMGVYTSPITKTLRSCPKLLGPKDIHIVVAKFDDGIEAEVGEGMTFVSRDFCAEHCPGKCQRDCVRPESPLGA